MERRLADPGKAGLLNVEGEIRFELLALAARLEPGLALLPPACAIPAKLAMRWRSAGGTSIVRRRAPDAKATGGWRSAR